MKTLLDDFGFERDIASNGKIAIEKLQEKSYDIILMDLQMPEMNGFEATHYIRNNMNSKIPIIALTADVTTVDLQKCTAVGMNDYLAKPVDEKLLYSKIVGLVIKPVKAQESEKISITENKKFVDLSNLRRITKSNTETMLEMISLYLNQTPTIIAAIKESLQNSDWDSLHKAVHKMIPSFSIVGIHPDYEEKARKIIEFARVQKEENELHELVSELEDMCTLVCIDLQQEYTNIKTANIKKDGKQ
jgi:CheY-like chemotaxis protein